MKIENNILKHYLKNVYFITGTAYILCMVLMMGMWLSGVMAIASIF